MKGLGTKQPPPPATPGAIRVAIIEDDRRIREGLAALINGSDGYRCTGAFRSMEEALARPWSPVPDVALIDIGLPGMSGIKGLPSPRERYPRVSPLMLTVYEDDERIFQALCAGACGYLLKKTPPARLLECLGEAARRRRADVAGGGAPRVEALPRGPAAGAGRATT